MGQSTNGEIIYGFMAEELDDSFTYEWCGEELDMSDMCAIFAGGNAGSWEDAQKSVISIENCCSGDYPMWIVGIRITHVVALRGDPTEISPNAFTQETGEWDKQLKAFADKFGLKFAGKGSWLLYSYWG